ncbi:dnaJ homolog subfamily C member 2 [Danio rerio]|uniref:DnaJ homolog subfamily C member 2 n=1 Tax=Danio rerio TaxID=7955 RepID=DNJC2_DANRE|nr:dnaJ homolog subfamily C member 2 [Danio rerio]Q6NWJ4.1 RecName: Full=DnaJ homolog subfamily C member 2 [Danio rerio]AAH67568.1 DnaJ (Hsp40) homolog, subfamily C, member 2 [Danio rerio]|eukprot:NP_997976.1 dnaJ homolog subfamily C member 2 [Danio rerio]
MLTEALEGQLTVVYNTVAASVQVQVEPVGRWFEAFLKRRNRNVSASFQELEEEEELSEEEEDEELQLEEYPMLKTLDPKDWKNQDHYAVLGLAHVRYKATQKQIKAAHKAMVLKHHPDKRKAAGEQIVEGDNDYFTCITKAIEILSDPVKRRAFDSVDPTFDNAVPTKAEGKENFFEVFAPVFERNARWSVKKHFPSLGTMESSFEDVDNFYSFWYNFDSWREFSYLDEEEKEKAECRDERRWIEKQNRASRAQRKKEEMNRIRTLVDTAYNADPRIKKFKEEEKARKESEKKAKVEAKKREQEEKERARQQQEEAARLLKEQQEEAARQAAQQAKKEKEAQKKAIKKERQKLRMTCKSQNYFTDNEADSVRMMEEVEKLCDRLELISLQTLNEALSAGNKEQSKAALEKQVQEVNMQLQKEKDAELQAQQAARGSEHSSAAGGQNNRGWSEEDLQLLIKAVNLFPAGTNARWEVIANYMNQHSSSGVRRTAKDVINKAKTLQKLDPHQKDEINRKAFEKFKKEHSAVPPTVDNAMPSERFDAVGADSNAAAWTTEEQKLLEQALKTYPVSTAERWERISEAVPGRSKKDCMKRYKELVEMIKAKKAAQEQVAAKNKK